MERGTFIKKPWGSEEILEINGHYMVKRLRMKAGCRCSLQQHRDKHETFVLISGVMSFTCENALGNLQTTLRYPGASEAIKSGVAHRMEAVTDIEYIEASTPHPDDVIRLGDDYGR